MRHLYLAACAAAMFFCAATAHADAPNLKNLDKPIELNAGDSKRMHVIFNHSSHKSVKCRTCHHEGLPGNRYASCTNKECHALSGASERDPMSVYMAYHAPDTDRSCYGCHKPLAGKYQGFKGCSPCHMTPQGRIAAAESQKK